jgi:hypothetical protein
MNEKFYSWMEKVGFFGGSVQDTTHSAIDEFFTEKTFREILNYDDEQFEKMADELGMEEIDWDRVQFLAHDVLTEWQADISKAAAVMGRKGGKVSSPAKSQAAKQRPNLGLAEGRKALAKLTPEQRHENAKKAAAARWGKK